MDAGNWITLFLGIGTLGLEESETEGRE